MLWALTFKRVSVFWQKVGINDTQTEDERESESVCLQGAQHWRYIASILPGVLLRVGQGYFMVAVCLSRPQFSCHTSFPQMWHFPEKKTWNPYYMSTNTHFQQFLFIYSISFENLAALYLKLANTSFLVAKRRSPPPREVFSLPATTMTV